jgi:hypothetical protein
MNATATTIDNSINNGSSDNTTKVTNRVELAEEPFQ